MIPILLLDLAGIVFVAGYILLDRRTNNEAGSPLPVHERHTNGQPPLAQMPAMPAISPEPMIARKQTGDHGETAVDKDRSAPSSSPSQPSDR